MRGIGGPLLCIGDLLSDVAEAEAEDVPLDVATPTTSPSPSPSPSQSQSQSQPQSDLLDFHPSRINQLFQDSYDQLNKALAGTDHSWTSLTLKLCTALDNAKKLIESANSNAMLISEKVGELEKTVKKGDSAIAEVRSIHSSLRKRIALPTESEA